MHFLTLTLSLTILNSCTLAAPTTLLSSPIANVESYLPTKLRNTVSTLTKKDVPFLNTTTTSPIVTMGSEVTSLQKSVNPYVQVLSTLSSIPFPFLSLPFPHSKQTCN